MAKKRYGLPYQGSKNAIAQWIVDKLPEADILYDLFMGGGAITHCALVSGKWSHIVCNDIQAGLPQFFMECLKGEHTVEKHKEWVSREDFFAKKDSDWYIKLCWSFGNNGMSYLYSKQIEGYKRAVWKAVVNKEYAELEGYGFDCSEFDSIEGIADRLHYFRHSVLAKFPNIEKRGSHYYVKDSDFKELLNRQLDLIQGLTSTLNLKNIENLQALQSLARLERLQGCSEIERLQSLNCMVGKHLDEIQSLSNTNNLNTLTLDTANVTAYNDSYELVPLNADDSIVYCDIPYVDTNCGLYGIDDFNHEAFYEWAREKDNIWVSEYSMPEDFIVIAEREKTVLSAGKGGGTKATEKLYVSKKTYDRWYI